MKTISLSELTEKLKSDQRPILIEALPARHFEQGHLPGAVNINIGESPVKAPGLLPDKNSEIVVYCASLSCTNSDQVAQQLSAMGYANVAVYKGGKAEWAASGRAFDGVPA